MIMNSEKHIYTSRAHKDLNFHLNKGKLNTSMYIPLFHFFQQQKIKALVSGRRRTKTF